LFNVYGAQKKNKNEYSKRNIQRRKSGGGGIRKNYDDGKITESSDGKMRKKNKGKDKVMSQPLFQL